MSEEKKAMTSSTSTQTDRDPEPATAAPSEKLCPGCDRMRPTESFRYDENCGQCYYEAHQLINRQKADAICLEQGWKECLTCHEQLPCTEFSWYRKKDNVLQRHCKECNKQKRIERRQAKQPQDSANPAPKKPKRGYTSYISVDSGALTKYCHYHDEDHPVAAFRIEKNMYTTCKKANVERAKKRREAIKKSRVQEDPETAE